MGGELISSPKLQVVFLATRWGSAYGGINCFNQDLVRAVAQCVETDVFITCVVLSASEADKADAKLGGVVLLSLNDDNESFNPSDHHRVKAALTSAGIQTCNWVVGHDTISGEIAYEVAQSFDKCCFALFHHMDFSAYEFLKVGKSPTDLQKKNAFQRDLLRKSNLIFAVGPKLFKSARDKISGRGIQVVELIPGLTEAHLCTADPPNSFSAITFGRLDSDTDPIKQASLAVRGFARAIKQNRDLFGLDPKLTLVGLPIEEREATEQHAALKKLAQDEAGRAVNITAYPYLSNRDALFHELQDKSVCLMLSVHEGFGLVGWEAISVGLPLILSENSGAYLALRVLLGGMGTGCVSHLDIRGSTTGQAPFQEDDVNRVAEALVTIRNHEKDIRRDALNLQRLLKGKCRWLSCALKFADNCNIPARKALADLEMTGSTLSHLDIDNGILSTARGITALTSRRAVYDQLRHKLKSSPPKHLILFGGIATALRSDDMVSDYVEWLRIDKQRRLYVCHETGEASEIRSRLLPENRMDASTGPTDPMERMIRKEEEVRHMQEQLRKQLPGREQQVVFIKLPQYLTSYIIVTETELFLTPLFNRRSTDSITFSCSSEPSELQRQTLDYMCHHLKASPTSQESSELLIEINKWPTLHI